MGEVTVDRIFDAVYPRLYRYCLRISSDPDLAEDAAQEAFVRLLDRKIEGGENGVTSWLFKVATHFLRDRARVSENRARLLEMHPVESPAPTRPDQELEVRDRIRRVREALSRLEERERTLLLLREEGFSYRELADAIGVQPSSVGTLLVRARGKFDRCLSGEMTP